MRRATMRWRSVGAIAPGGRMEVPAGARAEPVSASTRAMSTVVATQPLERRANLSIVMELAVLAVSVRFERQSGALVPFSGRDTDERIFRAVACHSFSRVA